jgi:uncharacterized protein
MQEQPLRESFRGEQVDPRLTWRCQPQKWEVDASNGCLRVWCDGETDFWQRTHYGMRADNGHLLYLTSKGNFSLETAVRMTPQNQYDQAGLMIWISPSCWIKVSVEHQLEGDNFLGAVVTNSGYSDWSTQPLDRSITQFYLRLHLDGSDLVAHWSLDGQRWQQLRIAPLLERRCGESVLCGLYACSPKKAGFCAEFEYLQFKPC